MAAKKVSSVYITRIHEQQLDRRHDLLAVEEPLEIRLGHGSLASRQHTVLTITMRTPGNDLELATGFLFAEGVINSRRDILRIRHCGEGYNDRQRKNSVRVELHPDIEPDLDLLERRFYTSSSCGVCGKASIEALRALLPSPLPQGGDPVSASVLHGLPAALTSHQTTFNHTGGIHAAALFSNTGTLQMVREDVGRHNALDKLIGAMLKPPYERNKGIILVSGRVSFELVQKTARAGIPVMAAIGAPSSLAVDLATETGLTLVGFLKMTSFNIYCNVERILIDE